MAGLYFHIPFCKQACIYCDFHFSTSLKQADEMVDTIIMELLLRKDQVEEPIETIYFGGGTPSLLSHHQFQKILNTVRFNFLLSDLLELTVEVNPDDLSTEKLEELKTLGVNRLSIGVQSFFEEHLKWMGRAHTAHEAEECILLAQEVGFDNITIDLIYGIPIMSDEEWAQNVQKAIALGVPHISAYNLTVEEKTVLSYMVKKGMTQDVDDEQGERNFQYLKDQLLANDFIQYEISNFGKEGFFSKHNSSYWLGKKYLGIGPSAHSFDGKVRRWNVSNNSVYIRGLKSGAPSFEEEVLSPKDRVNEHLMIGLRNKWGCSWEYLNETGLDLTQLKTEVVSKINTGYLEKTAGGFKTTDQGLLFADAIAADLFLE
ncbi:radical SAM family heme chaperone HemW [Parvicella tangerina]|uniref:Heme chaperone HemW n=1 Tax=Parvicella tangerina TaxID=2829795 RepID=A0A916JJF2_9FLAO|nr:radical SAM family heme chaperone HemW [Parvicella tangerina]CAG5076872.1 Heme chaperone HemW [Parvicella tangerina]